MTLIVLSIYVLNVNSVFVTPPPKTLFTHITVSPEVLAPNLVFWEGGWTSRFIQFTTTNREEAIAATLEKLKEPVSNDYAGSMVEG